MSLRALVDEPPHGLEKQSWAPREMQGAVVNADGWGCAWYLPYEEEPCVYRSGLPIWADANRFGLGRTVTSSCLLAAVRSSTDPLGHGLVSTQPFSYGPLAFLHNGYVKPFREKVLRPLRSTLCDEAYRSIRGDTDSEHYFALVIDEWLRAEGEAGARVVRALERATRRLLALTEAAGGVALSTAILTAIGTADCAASPRMAVQRIALNGSPPSLYVRSLQGGRVLASEPLDTSPEWRSVAPGSAQRVEPERS